MAVTVNVIVGIVFAAIIIVIVIGLCFLFKYLFRRSDFARHEILQPATLSDSVSSDCSVLIPNEPRYGQLEFVLEYDKEVSELVVSVIQAKDLPEEDPPIGKSIYVKCWLDPLPGKRRQTKTVSDTRNPAFMEQLLFSVEPEDLGSQTVRFQVYSSNKLARNQLIGETDIDLDDLEMCRPLRVWMSLRNSGETPAEYGDVLFSLSYLPITERLNVVVVKARDLKWSAQKQNGECFVKVCLVQNGKKLRRKKTTSIASDGNPGFNETMIFSLPSSALSSTELRLSVVERTPEDKLSSIGHVVIGSQQDGTCLTHWNQMMSSIRKPVAMWHSLRK